MKYIIPVLFFIAGAALVYFIGKSEEAATIKKEHAAIIVTITVQATSKIDSLLDLNTVLDQQIDNLKSIGDTKTNLLTKLLERENKLENKILLLNEKLHTYDYFYNYMDPDSSAKWIIRNAPN